MSEAVRDKYLEIWRDVHRGTKRYVRTWRNKFLTIDATSLDELIEIFQAAARELEAMRADGVTLDPDGTADDYATLVTTDPQVAKKYGLEDEAEIWDDDQLPDRQAE